LIHIVPILRDNYCYLLEGADKRCLILDPGQVTPVESHIKLHGLIPVAILNTHHHADHIAGNAELKNKFGILVSGPKAEEAKIPHMDKGLVESDIISESGIELSILETPGHTKGHIAFYWKEKSALFCGDTLFSMGCGRLLEGTAEDMFESLQKIKSLPPQTEIYCGHEYTKANGEFAATVEPDNQDIRDRMKDVVRLQTNGRPTLPVTLETEMKTNPFLRAPNVAAFATLRKQKDNF
jgi:hydroxyacylglutathione hydrolase